VEETTRVRVPMRDTGRSSPVVAEKSRNGDRSERGCVVCFICRSTRDGRSLVNKAKPFCISKWEVWEAYKRVKANKGAAGVDGQSIASLKRI